jgi:hypothetical protein
MTIYSLNCPQTRILVLAVFCGFLPKDTIRFIISGRSIAIRDWDDAKILREGRGSAEGD